MPGNKSKHVMVIQTRLPRQNQKKPRSTQFKGCKRLSEIQCTSDTTFM